MSKALAAALVPLVLSAQSNYANLNPSVRAILNKPRIEPARVRLVDGTTMDGYIVRVTTEFIALRMGSSCTTIEPAKIERIAKIKPPKAPLTFAGVVTTPLWWACLLLLVVSAAGDGPDRSEADYVPLGQWESVSLQNGQAVRLKIDKNQVLRRIVSVERGRYQLAGRNLLLDPEDGSERTLARQVVPFRFDCAALVLEDSPQSHALVLPYAPRGPADSPILGRWNETRTGVSSLTAAPTGFDSLTWEFRKDGTYQTERFTDRSEEGGSFKSDGHKMLVHFLRNNRPDHDEYWRFRWKSGRLWVEHDGETLEYRRVKGVF